MRPPGRGARSRASRSPRSAASPVGDAGPLSDFDLVLLHSGRSLAADGADRARRPASGTPSGMPGCGWTTACAPSPSAAASPPPTSPPPSACSTWTWVAGDPEVVAAARATVAHDWRGNARKRLPQLVESVDERHTRQGDLAQSLEPELKEAHGGLRDMTVLRAHGRGLAGRPPARRRRRGPRPAARRPRRRARRHRPGPRPPRPRGPRRRRRPARPTTTPTTC